MSSDENDDNNSNTPKQNPVGEEARNLPGSLKTRMKLEREEKEKLNTEKPTASSSLASTDKNDNGDDSSLNARSVAGKAMTGFSDLVNENLIAFRYGTVASITLLTAYGLANTPLFFRYKTARDIPGGLQVAMGHDYYLEKK
jgi:hypothetical protein